MCMWMRVDFVCILQQGSIAFIVTTSVLRDDFKSVHITKLAIILVCVSACLRARVRKRTLCTLNIRASKASFVRHHQLAAEQQQQS